LKLFADIAQWNERRDRTAFVFFFDEGRDIFLLIQRRDFFQFFFVLVFCSCCDDVDVWFGGLVLMDD